MSDSIESFIGIGKRDGQYLVAFEPPLTNLEIAEIKQHGLLDTTAVQVVGEGTFNVCSLVGAKSEELAILGAVKAARYLCETREHYIHADLWNVAELIDPEDTPFSPLD